MHRVLLQARLAHHLELGHERLGQVAVLENHPETLLHALLDVLHRVRSLPLAQRNRLDAHALRVGLVLLGRREVQQVGHRVGPRAQHEHQRDGRARILEAGREVERHRLDVLGPELGAHEVGDCGNNLIGPKGSDHHHALQGRERVVPRRGEHLALRLERVVENLPTRWVLRDVRG